MVEIKVEELDRRRIETAEALHECLVREFEALRARDTAGIERLAAEKSNLLKDFPLLSGSNGDTAAALSPSLRAALAKCRRQNQVNGAAVARLQGYTQRMLGVLRGDSPNHEIYGKSGRSISLPTTYRM